jgi:hypothetical protein
MGKFRVFNWVLWRRTRLQIWCRDLACIREPASEMSIETYARSRAEMGLNFASERVLTACKECSFDA